MIEAAKYNVLPIDDRTIERTNPATGGPPRPAGRAHVVDALRRDGRHDGEHLHQREEPLEDGHRGDRDSRGRRIGRLIVQGGRFGGWSLHLREGKPAYEYNWLGSGAIRRRKPRGPPGRQGDGETRLRLRWRRTRQGGRGEALRSTANRSPKAGSARPSRTSSRRTKPPTSGSTTRRRWPSASATAPRRQNSPARSTRSSSR